MSDEIAVKVEHVSKSFKLPHEKVDSVKSLFVNPFRSRDGLKTETQHALKDINFEVKKGEFFGIVGRNGSGKSTLLKIIAGIYQPTNGRATVNGRLVPFIELGVGFNPELTGRENVYLNGALMGFSDKEVDVKYKSIVDFAELERFMDQKLKNYSSGMQVRLAFSVATILADSEVLLIDEVLAVGDADFQRKCFNYFRMLKRLKKTVIFVSHDMEAMREYCDRCIFINDSKLIKEASADEISEMYIAMFNEEAEKKDTKDEQHIVQRWGDESATYTDVGVIVSESSVSIKTEIKFRETMENPIIGVQIKSISGQTICGTNNKILHNKILKTKRGYALTCVWEIPNILSTGDYTVDLAITHQDGVTQADWWNDAARFSIYKKQNTPHIVSPIITQVITGTQEN